MEQAIERLARAELHHSAHLHPVCPLLREYPQAPDLLLFSPLWCDGGGRWQIVVKGASEATAQLCHLGPEAAAALLRAAESLAAQSLRVLAVASVLDGAPRDPQLTPGSGGRFTVPDNPPEALHEYLFEPIGFVGLADPLWPDVPVAIALARGAGLRLVMITGDAPRSACAITDQAGLPAGPVLPGGELEAIGPDGSAETPAGSAGDAVAVVLAAVAVFARVLPRQKLQFVRALQAAEEPERWWR